MEEARRGKKRGKRERIMEERKCGEKEWENEMGEEKWRRGKGGSSDVVAGQPTPPVSKRG